MERETIQKTGSYFSIPERDELIKEYLSNSCTKEAIWGKYTGQREHGTLLKLMRDLGYGTQAKRAFSPKKSLMGNIGYLFAGEMTPVHLYRSVFVGKMAPVHLYRTLLFWLIWVYKK